MLVLKQSCFNWNGHGYKELLTDILQDMHDHDNCSNSKCAQSFNAGVDMFMVPENWKDLNDSAIKSGEISEIRLAVQHFKG